MEALQCLFPTLRPLYKVFWVILFIAATLIRMPFWCTCFLFKSARQHPKWTRRQSLCTRIFRAFIQIISLVRLRTPCDLKPGKEKEHFIVMPPAQERLYTGIITADPEIRPTKIGGTWYPSCESTQRCSSPLPWRRLHPWRWADCGLWLRYLNHSQAYICWPCILPPVSTLCKYRQTIFSCTARCSYLLRVPHLRPRYPAFQYHSFG